LVLDVADPGRLRVDAAVGDRRVAGYHVQRRHHGGAERQREVGVEIFGDAHTVRVVDDVVDADVVRELDRNDVAREFERTSQRHRSEKPVVVVAWAVVGAVAGRVRHFPVVVNGRDGDAAIDRGRIYVALEG